MLALTDTHNDVRRDAKDEAHQCIVEMLDVMEATVRLYRNTLDKQAKRDVTDRGFRLVGSMAFDMCASLIRDSAREIAEECCKNHLQFEQVVNPEGLTDDVTQDIRDMVRTVEV